MYASIRKILRVLRFCSRKPICQEDFMLVSLLVPELWKTIHHHKKNPIGTSKTSTSQAQIKFPMSTFWWLNMTCAMRGKKHEKLEDSHIYSSGLSTTRTTHHVQKANKNCDNLWFCPTIIKNIQQISGIQRHGVVIM